MSIIELDQTVNDCTSLPRDVAKFFIDRASQFGCTNILGVHLPTTERTIALVRTR